MDGMEMEQETAAVISTLEKAFYCTDAPAVRSSALASLAITMTERVAVKLLLAPKSCPTEVEDFIDSFAEYVLEWQRQHL